eukprot:CAMPEP_0181380984 /NCGR_PEP_ID=MMETSP1106-20121128/19862_1 /TAXON_ID=81844 /ORGANISM="Mantoniella antarctica, Strain SL-175" /LENGTH=202 /DNA_ID=CAMNT_0023500103 /DNA_START=98 /DNA_END=703 /DNA_ORIENTATION=+
MAAAENDDDDVVIVGVTSPTAAATDSARDAERAGKRARVDGPDSTSNGAGATTKSDDDTPLFRLLRTEGILDADNHGCVSLRDIVQGQVRWAILMNYMYDPYWLMDACPQLFNIPKVFAIHGQDELAQWPAKPANWEFYKPSVPPYGTVHSKAMLLVYEGGIRVAIFTANFVEMDNSYLSNAVWTQDFPKKNSDSPTTSEFE